MHRPRPAAAVLLVLLALAACSESAPAPRAQQAVPVVPAETKAAGPGPVLPGHGSFAATPTQPWIRVWPGPSDDGEPLFAFEAVNPFGQRLSMLVTAARRDDAGNAWFEVLLPMKPNGSTGWIRAGIARLVPVRERIVVDLSRRVLRHYRDGKLVHRFSVGIGAPDAPTATGTFYVWARVPQANPAGPYGVYALGISGFSEALSDWPGGGRMAIHGTPDASDRGRRVSHGCVRVYNPDMRELRHVPLGTPVIIER